KIREIIQMSKLLGHNIVMDRVIAILDDIGSNKNIFEVECMLEILTFILFILRLNLWIFIPYSLAIHKRFLNLHLKNKKCDIFAKSFLK
ncbi:hypothetical protein ACJX0J_007259, partial [Zea mays]